VEGSFDRRGDLALLAELNVGIGVGHDLGTKRAAARLQLRQLALERGREAPNGGGLILEPFDIFYEPVLSVSTSGTFLAAWTTYSPVEPTLKLAVGHLPSPRLGAPVTAVMPAGFRDPQVAVNPTGDAVIMGVQGGEHTEAQVLGLFLSASAQLSAPVDLGEVGNTNQLGQAAIAIAENGEGVAVWEADPNFKETLVARRFRVP
jgi:hypothetical protein